MSRGRVVVYAVGLVLVAIILARLPDALLRSTQLFLYFAAGLLLATVAAALVFLPARRLLVEVFSMPIRVPERGAFGFAPPDQVNVIARPLLVALACVLVAVGAGLGH